MNISIAQGIIGTSAIISAISALMFGVFDDNLYRYRIGRRFGRRHLMLMLIAPSLLIGVLLWIPGSPVPLYACVYVLWVVLAQAFQAYYNPLPGEMTKDFSQRTKLSTTRMFISTSAATFIPLAGSWALSIYGETKATAYMVVAIISTLMFSCAVVITWKRTWELTSDEAGFGEYANGTVHESHLGLSGWIRRVAHVMREYATTLRIREFRKHLTIFLLVQTSSDVFGQTFLFFVLYDWNKTAAFASLLLGCSIVSLPFMPAFGKAVVRFGVRKLYAFGLCRNAAWRGLAGIGMDSDGCSARCSMDGAVRYRIVVVPCIQGACRIPAVDGIGVHAGYQSDCYASVSFGHFFQCTVFPPTAWFGHRHHRRWNGSRHGRIRFLPSPAVVEGVDWCGCGYVGLLHCLDDRVLDCVVTSDNQPTDRS